MTRAGTAGLRLVLSHWQATVTWVNRSKSVQFRTCQNM
jgi:hypothetical protein